MSRLVMVIAICIGFGAAAIADDATQKSQEPVQKSVVQKTIPVEPQVQSCKVVDSYLVRYAPLKARCIYNQMRERQFSARFTFPLGCRGCVAITRDGAVKVGETMTCLAWGHHWARCYAVEWTDGARSGALEALAAHGVTVQPR